MDEVAARNAFDLALRTYRQEFGSFFLARLFGLEISFDNDVCVVEVPVRDFQFNPQGSLHGGVIAFAMDVSMGHLIHHVIGRAGITLEMKTQYMRPALRGQVRCEGRFLKQGRALSFMESRMLDEGGKLLAVATATWQMPRQETPSTSGPGE